MRVLLLRIGALGAMVVLGWIAIANAQRGQRHDGRRFERHCRGVLPSVGDFAARRFESSASRDSATDDTTGGTVAAARAACDAAGSRAGRAANCGPSVCRSESGQRGIKPARRRTACEFHPRCVGRWSGRAASEHRGDVPLPAGGHACVGRAAGGGPDVGCRRSEPVEQWPRGKRAAQTASRDAPRYGEAAESQGAAPFNVDPFAKPASSTRAVKADRGAPDAQAESSRPAEPATEAEGTGQPGSQQLEGTRARN